MQRFVPRFSPLYGIAASIALSILGASTAWAGAPFVTDDADTPEAGHFEINIAAQYLRFQGGSAGTTPSVEVNYGVTDKLQVTILTPLAMAHIDHVGTNVGIGDTELSVKYRFVDADDWGWKPSIAFAPLLIVPSGSEQRGLGGGQMQGFLPIWLTKEINQWTIFGGGGYNINPGVERKNWWFTGVGVTRELTPEWTVGVEIFHTTPTEKDAKDNTAFNVGAIYNISNSHHVMVSVGRNLINARENNEFSAYIGYQINL
jgi:hypothetical protein